MSFGAVEKQPDEKRPYNINDVDTSSNQENIVVPYGAGVFKATVDWISPLYNLTSKKVKQQGDTKGKGSSGDTGQKNWYADVGGITNVCPDDAPNDAILFIFVNDEVALTGPLYRVPGQHYVAFSIPKYCPACRFYWGTKDQPIDNLVLYPRQDAVPVGVNPRDISTWPRLDSNGDPVDDVTDLPGVANPKSGHYDFHGAYRNQGLFAAKQFFVGSSPNMPSVVMVLARGTQFFAGARFEAGEKGVNPMGTPYELLTCEPIGAGIPESRLVQSGFQATADAMDAAGLKLAPMYRSAQSARSLFADYFQYYDGFFRRSLGSSIEAGYFEHGDIDVSALQVIGSAELVEQPKIKPGDLAETKNSFFVGYTNRAKWWKDDDSEGYVDQANYERVGVERDQHFDRPFIIDGDLAMQHCVEYGKIAALELATGSAVCRRDQINGLKPGQRFTSDVASLALAFVWRLKNAEKPGDRDGTIKLTVEAERGIGPVPYYPPPAPKPPDFEVKPAGVAHAIIKELPSGLTDSSSIQVQVLWERPSNDILGLKVHVSDDDDLYTLARTQHHYAMRGKLAVAYSAARPDLDVATGFVVDLLGIDLDSVAGQIDAERDDNHLLAWIGNEIFSIGDKIALGNGRFRFYNRGGLYGTAKASHLIGAEVWFIFRDWLERIEDRNFAAGVTRYFKLQPFIYGGDYDINLVDSIPFNFSGGAVSAISNLQLTTSARVAAGRIESRIAATWDYAQDQDVFAFEVAIKRTADPAAWQYRTVNTPSTDWEVAPSTSYDVKVRPINSHGAPSAFCAPVTIVSASISPFSITGLEIDGQGNDTEWRERDLKLACRLNSPSSGINVGGTIQTGVQDPSFAYILWQIFVGGALVYDEQTVVNKFQFTEAKNQAAYLRVNGTTGKFGLQGQPLTINVYAVDSLRNVSTPAILTVQNSAPVAPGLTALGANNRTILLGITPGSEADLDKIRIYRNTVNDSSTATLIAEISAKNTAFVDTIIGASGSTTFYYWAKTVDTFGNTSPFSTQAHATSDPLSVISDINDFEIDETKLSLRIVILRGDAWIDNSPAAGSIAWNDHNIVYAGALHPIAAGNTALKYLYWNIGDDHYTASDTPLDLAGGRFLIAQNRAGTHVEAWNSFANLVVGFANIAALAVRDANILNLAVEKILAGTILGKDFIIRNDAGTPSGFRSYDYDGATAGFFLGMLADGTSFLDVFRGLIRCALNVGGVFQVAANGVVTIGPLTIGTDGSFKINAGATSFNVDPDGKMWMGASTFAAAPYRVTNAGFLEAEGATFHYPVIIRPYPPPTFTNDYTGLPLGDRTYNDNDLVSFRAHGLTGKKMRFTTDGSEVTKNSPYWPWHAINHGAGTFGDGIGPDDFSGFPVGGSGYSGVIRACVVDGPNGEYLGEEASLRLTHVPIDLLPLPVAPPPDIIFSSGARGSNGYKVRIVSALAVAQIKWSWNAGAAGSYSDYDPNGNYNVGTGSDPTSNIGEVALGVDFPLAAYVIKDGYAPSAVTFFYNTARDPVDPGWRGPPGTNAP